MKFLSAIDNAGIKVASEVTQFLGRHFGKSVSNIVYTCAIASTSLRVCSGATLILDSNYNSNYNIPPILFPMVILACPILISLLFLAKESEHWPNTTYARYYWTRLTALLVNILLYFDIFYPMSWLFLDDASWFAYTLGLYFAACPPAPPKQNKEHVIRGTPLKASA
jgi:hypothetical protein